MIHNMHIIIDLVNGQNQWHQGKTHDAIQNGRQDLGKSHGTSSDKMHGRTGPLLLIWTNFNLSMNR